MHKVFYASGFLYHPPTQQILLQQLENSQETSLILVRRKGHHKETPAMVLQRVLEKILQLRIPLQHVYPIYDYADSEIEGNHFITYAVVKDTMQKKLSRNPAVKWVAFKQIPKLKLSEQTKQDIIVGQRVINLANRLSEEKIQATQ